MSFTGRRLFTSLLGLLALESALATVLLIAANPPQTPRRVEIHLSPARALKTQDLPPSELVALARKRDMPPVATPLQAFARLKPLGEPVASVMMADRIAPAPFVPRRDPLHPPARLPDVLPVDRVALSPRPREVETSWLLAARDRLDPAPPPVATPPEAGVWHSGPNPALGRRIRSLNLWCSPPGPILCRTRHRRPSPT